LGVGPQKSAPILQTKSIPNINFVNRPRPKIILETHSRLLYNEYGASCKNNGNIEKTDTTFAAHATTQSSGSARTYTYRNAFFSNKTAFLATPGISWNASATLRNFLGAFLVF
jgi:hypothetical protein